VIKLHHALIPFLTGADPMTSILVPNLPFLYSTSEESRIGAVRALGEQYQRIMQSQPLRQYLRDISIFDPIEASRETLPFTAHSLPCGDEVDGTIDTRSSNRTPTSYTSDNLVDPNIGGGIVNARQTAAARRRRTVASRSLSRLLVADCVMC
jgi:hypothetical protein